jgi:uncharacterized membrane protein
MLLPQPMLRVPFGLVLALFVPGYALSAVLFPRKDDVDLAVRVALSFGLSVATLPVLALLLDLLSVGIRPWPIAVSLALWLLILSGLAIWRRRGLYGQGLLDGNRKVDLLARWPNWAPQIRKPVVIAAVAVVLAGFLLPEHQETYTEFFVVNQQGQAEDYPRQAVTGEALGVVIGIVNQEAGWDTYRVEIWAADPWNPARRQVVGSEGAFTLAAGQSRRQPVSWRMPWPGEDQMVEFLLFREGSDRPYRRLQLWLDVVESSDPR